MNNRAKLEEKLKEEGMTISCYDKRVDDVSEKELTKVLEKVEYGSGDVQVSFKGQPCVVEFYHVGDEVDFDVISEKEYESQYGRRVSE